MTISVKVGNIVDEVKAGIIIQQVNAQGVMGSGVAKDIRDKYPIVWQEYSKHVGPAYTQQENGRHLLGMMIPVQVDTDLWVCNIVSQQFFGREPQKQPGGRYTSYDALANGLWAVKHFVLDNMLAAPIHFPLIGCGLGGGDWRIVSSIIEAQLTGFNKSLWVLQECDKPEQNTRFGS